MVQLSEWFRIWIGYRSPQFLTFGYGLDMDFMKKFRIGSGLQNFRVRTPLIANASTSAVSMVFGFTLILVPFILVAV